VIISQKLSCPLHLYLEEIITVPGGLEVGSVDQHGKFQYGSDISAGYQDYFYQEFRGYIEESKRESFSSLNRELKGRETIRNDLLHDRDIYVVTDCLDSLVPLNGLIESLKSIRYKSITLCSPLAMSKDTSTIQQLSDRFNIIGFIDFFYGVDHYYEDNSTLDRERIIQVISDTLKLWPATG
jgi:predicted phosphoribosyltransferase